MSNLTNKTLIQSVGFGTSKMYIELNTGRVLPVPYTYTKRLNNATMEQLQSYKLIANGIGIHFNQIDEDISLEGIIRDFGAVTKRINISVSQNFLDEADRYATSHNKVCSFTKSDHKLYGAYTIINRISCQIWQLF